MKSWLLDAVDDLRSSRINSRFSAQTTLEGYIREAIKSEQSQRLELLLASEIPEARAFGIKVMMRIDCCEYARLCVQFLKDSEGLVRATACSMLAVSPTECIQFAVPAICELLAGEEYVPARYGALEALERANNLDALPILREVAKFDHATNSDGYMMSELASDIIEVISSRDVR
jgi:hypothetical protein